MKINKWHIDYNVSDGCYWVYCKKKLLKATGKEYPAETTYFNTLVGALKDVRRSLIGSKIGRDKEDDLATIIEKIKEVDQYFLDCLDKMPKLKNGLIESIDKA